MAIFGGNKYVYLKEYTSTHSIKLRGWLLWKKHAQWRKSRLGGIGQQYDTITF